MRRFIGGRRRLSGIFGPVGCGGPGGIMAFGMTAQDITERR